MMESSFPESGRLGARLRETPIAIVGIGGIFPGARNIKEFWEGLKEGYDGTDRVPAIPSYWEEKLYVKPRSDKSPVSVPHSIAGYLPEVRFDPTKYGITPRSLAAISSFQLYSLLVAEETLRDAGLGQNPEWEKTRANTGVILATSGIGSNGYESSKQLDVENWRCVLREQGLSSDQAEAILAKISSIYPSWQENTFPGLLPNICAGRIANRFDLRGPNYTVDAACAASMAAIRASIYELLVGSVDAVLTGAVNVDNSIFAFLCYEEVKALSRRGQCRPFDADSDGMILGDAVGMMMLKRLPDAERDGDKIYAIMRGMGAASDGLAKSIYAPHWQGQVEAMRRAYGGTGLSPLDVSVIEMHGTGTPVGDPVEVHSIKNVYGAYNIPPGSVAIGSVKSNIGHTRLAAGVVSTIKMALALSHKQVPPTIHVKRVNPKLGLEGSPFYVNTSLRPWVSQTGVSRKAGINAFGFGGTNFHLIMEEYTGFRRAEALSSIPQIAILAAENPKELLDIMKGVDADLSQHAYFDILARFKVWSSEEIPLHYARIGLVIRSWDDLRGKLSFAIEKMEQGKLEEGSPQAGLFYFGRGLPKDTAIVALYPGQGVQTLQMGLDLICCFPTLIDLLGAWDEYCKASAMPTVSRLLYPLPDGASHAGDGHLTSDIHASHHAQLVLGFISHALTKILRGSDFCLDYAVGHSFGELAALYSAGVLDDAGFIQVSVERAKAMAPVSGDTVYSLLAVSMPTRDLQQFMGAKSYGNRLYISCINAPEQTVVGGPVAELEQLKGDLTAVKARSVLLKVGHAFHTPYMAASREQFRHALKDVKWGGNQSCKILSCMSGDLYPAGEDAGKELLSAQLVSPVQFEGVIRTILERSKTCHFVEIGPKVTLTQLVKSIVGQDHDSSIRMSALNAGSDKPWVESCASFLAELCCLGLARPGPFAVQLDTTKPVAESSVTVTIDGGVNYGQNIDEQRKKLLVDLPFTSAAHAPAALLDERHASKASQPMLSESLCQIQSDFLDLQRKLQVRLDSADSSSKLSGELQGSLRQRQDQLAEIQMKFLEQLPHFMGAGGGSRQKTANILPAQPAIPLVDEVSPPEKKREAPARTKDPESIRTIMIRVVHEKTGYPQDLIKMDQDIEMDLGIDSIKRLEILSEMAEHFPEFSLENVQEAQIAHLRTLGQIHGFIVGLLENTPTEQAPAAPKLVTSRSEQPPLAEKRATPPLGLTPYEAKLTPTPVPILDRYSGQNQPLLVFALSRDEWTSDIGDKISRHGYEPIVIVIAHEEEEVSWQSDTYPLVVIRPSDDLESLKEHFFSEMAGSQVGLNVVFLSPQDSPTREGEPFDFSHVGHVSEAIFKLCHALLKKDAPKISRFLTISQTDGCLGMTGTSDYVAMGLGAYVKSLAREFADLPIRHVDINRQLSVAEKHLILLQELALGDHDLQEVGRRETTSRLELGFNQVHFSEALAPSTCTEGEVILVTGGGRGITADCLAALAKRQPARYVILGRTRLTDEPVWAQGIQDEMQLKQRIAEHLSVAEPGFPAKAVKEKFQEICRQRAVRAQLESLTSAGVDAYYMALDITDKAAVKKAMDHIQTRIGAIGAFIHGAGIALDRKLVHKTFSDFDRVIKAKIEGLFHILNAMDMAPLKRIVLFSSISAVVGNAGQTDYAMANGILNGLAYHIKARWPHVKASAIAWGPWNGGLVDGTLRHFFEKRGIPLIAPDAGSAAFVETFLYPDQYGTLTLISKDLNQTIYERADFKGMGFGS
jgi:acyl transferase domain-containing protein/NAD(P)-dependent dehydrogenase (short-subunit alcohol dehydrogenase family)